MQLCILDILKAIDFVCLEHNITYYIIAGTQLGATRHEGFIPWDDDADVAMPRPDYERFIKHADEWLPEYYRVIDGTKDIHYPYAFARVHDIRTTYLLFRNFNHYTGVPVDIFPLDGMIENHWRQRWHYFRYRNAVKLLYFSTVNPFKHGHGIYSIFIRIIQHLVSPEKAHAKVDALQHEYDYEQCILVADHDNSYKRSILPKEVYGQPQRVNFCDTQLNGVHDPDTYLRYCYGDYLKPITAEHPNFRELDLHNSYLNKK